MLREAPGVLWVSPDAGECKRGFPKPNLPITITVQTDHLGWETTATVIGQDGSRLDPVFSLRLEQDWSVLLRRTSARVKVEVPADLMVPDARRPERVSVMRGRLSDISHSGCRAKAVLSAHAGTIVTIRLTLPSTHKELVIMGQIVRCDSTEGSVASELGIRFVQMEEAAHAALLRWLAEHEEQVAA
jgi:c-di-GMP-binding flagellar brake protein YcgR